MADDTSVVVAYAEGGGMLLARRGRNELRLSCPLPFSYRFNPTIQYRQIKKKKKEKKEKKQKKKKINQTELMLMAN